jgi:peptide-methionine (R)-S-oxide reductase
MAEKVVKSEQEWRAQLTPEQYHVTREHGTERAFTGAYHATKAPGVYHCVCCGQPLFDSDTKFESGTGWPSFYEPMPGSLATKRDFKLFWPRTEYHCARCGGHQGHVFDDGPEPTGQRYCNNGVALLFVPDGEPLPELVG